MGDLISTNTTAKYGLCMVAGIAGGIILLILKALPWFVGLIAGALVLFVGLGILYSKNAGKKLLGIISTATGALVLLSQLPPLKWLLIPGAVALFVLGIWNGIKFLLSIKSRA